MVDGEAGESLSNVNCVLFCVIEGEYDAVL